MTTLKDYLTDYAKEIIFNVVELKDPKSGATEYDEFSLDMITDELITLLAEKGITKP